MGIRDRKNGVPNTAASIPLVDPHAMPANPSIGDLVKDATAQMSTLVRAEVELAKTEITRDVKKGLTGSVYFILALVVLLYSTFFMFFFLAELLDTWLWRWAAFLIVFILMLVVTAVFALLGFLKVRRIRGPQQTIESVKETTAALTPGLAKFTGTPAPRATSPALESAPSRSTATTAVVQYETSAEPGYTEYEYIEPIQYSEPIQYTEPVRYTEYVEYVEPDDQAEYVEYVEYTEQTDYADYAEQSTEYAAEYTEYAQPSGYAEGHDPTAAVYADTGLPVTPDRLPGGSSGW